MDDKTRAVMLENQELSRILYRFRKVVKDFGFTGDVSNDDEVMSWLGTELHDLREMEKSAEEDDAWRARKKCEVCGLLWYGEQWKVCPGCVAENDKKDMENLFGRAREAIDAGKGDTLHKAAMHLQLDAIQRMVMEKTSLVVQLSQMAGDLARARAENVALNKSAGMMIARAIREHEMKKEYGQ